MKKIITIIAAVFIFLKIDAQNTVGLLSYDPANTFDGYNLFFPHNQGNVYLLDNCGRIVNVWEDSVYVPGNGYYLQPNGNLYKCIGRGAASNSYIHAGGGGEAIEIRDWDNNLVWRWFYNDSTKRLHHDIAVMDNGHILAIAWERKSAAEAIAAGRDTTLLTQNEVWPEHIIEIIPVGSDSATIVWRWSVWDHLIQDYDNTKANFGNPASNPRKIDLNYVLNGNADWQHANGIDYNEELDQILLCVPNFDEIWVIDHSTTTQQASTSFGGASGHGGDLIYRWGNPRTYRQGDSTDQTLFFAHDAHFADRFLSPTNPDYGKIAVFNNQAGADFSTVNTFVPDWDMYMFDYPLTGNKWGPTDFDWTYKRPDSTAMYSTGLSSLQILPNGNKLICVGRFGYSFEITADEDIVWEYKNPMIAGIPISQGTALTISQNLQFRMHRYPADFTAFTGRDLSAKGYIELNPDTTCPELPTWIPEIGTDIDFMAYPNPVAESIMIRFDELSLKGLRIIVSDIAGRELITQMMDTRLNLQKINVSSLAKGAYIVCIAHQDEGVIANFKFIKEK